MKTKRKIPASEKRLKSITFKVRSEWKAKLVQVCLDHDCRQGDYLRDVLLSALQKEPKQQTIKL